MSGAVALLESTPLLVDHDDPTLGQCDAIPDLRLPSQPRPRRHDEVENSFAERQRQLVQLDEVLHAVQDLDGRCGDVVSGQSADQADR